MAGEVVVLEGGVDEDDAEVEVDVEVDVDVDEGVVVGEVTTPLLFVEEGAPASVLLTASRPPA